MSRLVLAVAEREAIASRRRAGCRPLCRLVAARFGRLKRKQTIRARLGHPAEFLDLDAAQLGKSRFGSLRLDDVIVGIARAGHGADDQCAAGLDERFDTLVPFGFPHQPMGDVEHFEAREIVLRMDEAAGDAVLVAIAVQARCILERAWQGPSGKSCKLPDYRSRRWRCLCPCAPMCRADRA